jgi:hypothetical protein
LIVAALGPAIFDDEVLALDETGVGEPIAKRAQPFGPWHGRLAAEETDALAPRLCPQGDRRRDADQHGYKSAPVHESSEPPNLLRNIIRQPNYVASLAS